MTEHQYLRAVNNEIEHHPFDKIYLLGIDMYVKNPRADEDGDTVYDEVDVREIIFTPEFMAELKNKKGHGLKFSVGILMHLDKPAEYLYNTLGLNHINK